MISVCIATHNGSKYIREQLDSILSQIGTEDEIIISDDGSTDDTLSIINSYHDERIHLINFHQPENHLSGQMKSMLYASRNFENALKHTNGDYIFLSDQDDIWYPDKLERVQKALLCNDIIKHNFTLINENGKDIGKSKYTADGQNNRSWLHLIKVLPFRGCCIAFRRSILDAAFPFPQTCLQHDSWIGLVARLVNARFTYLEEPLLYHRVHSENVSELAKSNTFFFKIRYRLVLINQILRKKFLSKNTHS